MTQNNVNGWCRRFTKENKATIGIIIAFDKKGQMFAAGEGDNEQMRKIALMMGKVAVDAIGEKYKETEEEAKKGGFVHVKK